jgi:transcriptional regulator with XRE-family HTH domain
MITSASLAQRFSDRLSQLLDQHGAPKNSVSRSRALSELLGGFDPSHGARLLSGKEPPNWNTLARLCDYFNVEPGFFLDSSINNSVPFDTEPVSGLTGGDTIAWRAPSGSGTQGSGRNLGWLSGKRVVDLIEPTDFVIVDKSPSVKFVGGKDSLCMAENLDGQYFAVKVHASSNQSLTLQYLEPPPDGEVSRGIITLTPTREVNVKALQLSRLASLSPVVGTIRVAKHMHF